MSRPLFIAALLVTATIGDKMTRNHHPRLRVIKPKMQERCQVLELRGGASGEFTPIAAAIGGCFVGVASGVSMLSSARVAGNSGALKAFVSSNFDDWTLSYLVGLVLAGAAMAQYLPSVLEPAPGMDSLAAISKMAAGGLAVGVGTKWANGCTSGHGLCGLSRLSLRSFAAVATFLASASATRTMETGLSFSWLPMLPTTADVLRAAGRLALGFGAALFIVRCILVKLLPAMRDVLYGLWSGSLFGVGLVVGGMARPSTVMGALSPATLDLTLWTLFVTGLAVTFAIYRIAEAREVTAARADARSCNISSDLLVGSALFGVGWALTGICPGPLVVGIGASPVAPGLLVYLASFTIGVRLFKDSTPLFLRRIRGGNLPS